MKKIIILIPILVLNFLSFGQNVQKERNQKGTYGIAGGRTKEKVNQIPVKEKVFQNNNKCFSGIEYKVKNTGKFSGDDNSYSWWIRFKNNYKKPVAFSYRLLVGGVEYAGGGFGRTYTIKPGESYANDWGTLHAMLFNSSSDKYEVEIKELCFGNDDCTKNGYVECGSTSNKSKPTVYAVIPYDSPENSNNPNYGKIINNDIFIPTVKPIKVKKIIPETNFILDKNIEPQNILEQLITFLKSQGYHYEETTYQKYIPEAPEDVFFNEFRINFYSNSPQYNYETKKHEKRWLTGIVFWPRGNDYIRDKCSDCQELNDKIKVLKN